MRLIVGLGNPGPKYERNRHNVGFMAADGIHRRHAAFGPWRARFQSEVSEGVLGGEKTLLMKPQTYMNESGRAVGEAVRFFKLSPEDVCVLYDELDLAPGKTRMKKGGGHGGHNGLRSISAHIGPEYRRLRIGIGHPGRKELVTHWVLGDFAKSDRDWLEPLLDAIAAEAPLLAEGKDSQFANRIHLATAPEKPARPKAEKKPAPAAPAPGEGEAPPATPAQSSKKGPLSEGLKRLFGSRGSD